MVSFNPNKFIQNVEQNSLGQIRQISTDLMKAGTFNHEKIIFVNRGGYLFPKTAPDNKEWMIVRWIKSFFVKPTISAEVAEKVGFFFGSQKSLLSDETEYKGEIYARTASPHALAQSALRHISSHLPKNATKLADKIYNLSVNISYAYTATQTSEEKKRDYESNLHSYI